MAGKPRKVRWSWRVSAILLGMFLLGGSVAVASIPQGNTINACRNAQTGALRVIDTSSGAKCATGELPLQWSRWNWRSVWLKWPQYYVSDVVSYGGSAFIARAKPPIGTPPTNTTYWNLVVSKGAIGLTGLQGIPGIQGLPGVQGIQGIPGVPGVQGLQGIPGVPGVAGAVGATGPQGIQGLVGATGSQGLPGSQGIQGLVGPTGSQGLPGSQGIQGLTGATGATGVVDAIFAKINSNGTLATGKHVSTASSTGGLTPTYTVTFDQNVSQCAVSVVPEGVVAIPVLTAHAGSSISLTLTQLTGLLTPSGFDVTVTC